MDKHAPQSCRRHAAKCAFAPNVSGGDATVQADAVVVEAMTSGEAAEVLVVLTDLVEPGGEVPVQVHADALSETEPDHEEELFQEVMQASHGAQEIDDTQVVHGTQEIDNTPMGLIMRGGDSDGQKIRKTPENPPRISAIDVIMVVNGATQKAAGQTLRRLIDTAERIQNETRIGSPF